MTQKLDSIRDKEEFLEELNRYILYNYNIYLFYTSTTNYLKVGRKYKDGYLIGSVYKVCGDKTFEDQCYDAINRYLREEDNV